MNGKKAKVDKVTSGNNCLVEKPQYVLSYNSKTKNANWVSWQLNKSWVGNITRPQMFAEDITLPPTFSSALSSRPTEANYNNSIYTKGHLTPSSDRNRSKKDIASTYILSNIIPQYNTVNEQAWADLETHIKNYATQNGREIYNIAGGIQFDALNGQAFKQLLQNDNVVMAGISIPEFFWKVALVLERPGIQSDQIKNISSGLIKDVIAVKMPNDVFYSTFTPAQKKWEYWRTSVDEIEALTGLDLLSNLSDNVETVIEAIDPGKTRQALYP